jgi:hypothetical protein
VLVALLAAVVTGTAVAVAVTSTASHTPFGHVDQVVQTPDGFHVQGWAIDPDTTASIHVDVYVDGHDAKRLTANGARADIGRKYPSSGPNHGYSANLAVTAGTHKVCIYAINTGAGSVNPQLGCVTITINFDPRGAIVTVTQFPGGFSSSGWAYDPSQPSTAITVAISVDGTKTPTTVAKASRTDIPAQYPAPGTAHGWSLKALATEGSHRVCISAVNVGTGSDASVGCRTVSLNFSPVGAITGLRQVPGGFRISGWAQDPDTSSPVTVDISSDATHVTSTVANLSAPTHSGHSFLLTAKLPGTSLAPGTRKICITGTNLGSYGKDRQLACQSISLNYNPYGRYDSVVRASDGTSVVARGWAMDPDTTGVISIQVTVDGVLQSPLGKTGVSRPDVARAYPGTGSTQGYSITYKASDGEHRVCVTAVNALYGSANAALGCKIINAVHPKVPSAPQSVTAVGGFGGATVSWASPASDGGAPWSKYVVTASPGGAKATVGARATSATVTGLAARSTYSFTVVAVNVVGASPAGKSNAVTTQAVPPPQTTPAPISTSRYIRNVSSATSTDLSTMRAEGAADAKANPSGHGYLILLDIGGQDQIDGGVLLSATTHLVSYPNLVKDINAYVDGYHSAQHASAPVVIALGTNNDVDVSSASGKAWADLVVDPVAGYATKYTGITIAGANDIEPGFRGTYTQTRAWLSGYLAATHAPFVNNGSADGCAWTATNHGCNNGWTMSGLYYLSAGAAPVRIVNLPQIYNNTMAAQWKYISLTGVEQSSPRINFGGALTEWTACQQSGGCGSLTGNSAWTQLWSQLQSSVALKIGSLPYSTDLRIDR